MLPVRIALRSSTYGFRSRADDGSLRRRCGGCGGCGYAGGGGSIDPHRWSCIHAAVAIMSCMPSLRRRSPYGANSSRGVADHRQTLHRASWPILGRLRGILIVVLLLTVGDAALAHDWYTGLRSPKTGGQCCNDRDCEPVPHRSTPGGMGVELMIDGTWFPVEPHTVLGLFSPDGQAHACWPRSGEVKIRCVILPGMGM